MNDNAPSKLLDYEEAAAYLALPIGTLRAMVHRKTIPHHRLGPRTVRFDRADLDAWLASHRVAS